MLDKLSVAQIEAALKYLHSPLPEPPPQGLEELNQLEWFLLDRMLERLLQEKDHSPLQ